MRNKSKVRSAHWSHWRKEPLARRPARTAGLSSVGEQDGFIVCFCGSTNRSKRRPRPRLTTRDENETIIAVIQNNPFSNAAATREALHLKVCAQTVGRTYNTESLPLPGNMWGRTWSFGRVVFTDEKTFASTNHGKIHLWRPNYTGYDRAHIYEVPRSGHRRIHAVIDKEDLSVLKNPAGAHYFVNQGPNEDLKEGITRLKFKSCRLVQKILRYGELLFIDPDR
ncbi:hypothetical protein Hamer_G024957 [Homarus americanus]|uniref:Uncharacterized protein n=1 Tax=Homarus americanus TaxID=6706 RepID=A0A8J5JGR8_HOMAM|nr:hypothetical protein Hamer_G024957 [Homarus americanus]